MKPPIFVTARLIAREQTLDDLDFVASILGDPEVMRFYPQCYSREEAEGWIQRALANYASDGFGRWLIQERAGGNPVGLVGLLPNRVGQADVPELVYMIGRTWWLRGYALEAASAARDYAFDTLGASRVISLIRPENLPSRAVAMRLGMKPGQTIFHAELEHLVFSVDRPGRADPSV